MRINLPDILLVPKPADLTSSFSPDGICPEGDIVLEVGHEKEPLRVESDFLTYTSGPFKDILDSIGYHKRPPRCADEPLSTPTVWLEDDDFNALYTICCVLHHQPDLLPPFLVPEQILQVALVATKYDWSKALTFARAYWLNPAEKPSFIDAAYLFAATAAFGDEDLFRYHSLQIILGYIEPYTELRKYRSICQVLPVKIFSTDQDLRVDMLEWKRIRLRIELSKLMFQGAFALVACNWDSRRRDRFFHLHQAKYNPFKISEVPLSQVMDDMRMASYEETGRPEHNASCGDHNLHAAEFANRLAQLQWDSCIDMAVINSDADADDVEDVSSDKDDCISIHLDAEGASSGEQETIVDGQ
ncbi:hypothetical protein PFICI_00248 [Pestalotiopsis fici W106-1]|uniref:BTB domain-containing protein n=1 Tax=Pestalotiopsis fici (strain W106-1 / CGMCC3.15140) TaxID=1229662 RepID=W3XK94_PESFW|nr:uncharacterized protein PFICI_00248 [Pestalotiopsis fici W106-1]ETS86420.1 hypothetical protein PFICI_00248 [Pestalotiopsis fici W106-1]